MIKNENKCYKASILKKGNLRMFENLIYISSVVLGPILGNILSVALLV